MAVAEFPLPPFPYEKDFFESPFPKGGKKALCRFSERNRTRRNQMDEQEKEIEEILRTFEKHLRLRRRIVFKIKQNTKDKLSQAKAGISPLHAKPQ